MIKHGLLPIWTKSQILFFLFLRVNIKISPIFRPMWRNLSTFSNDSLNILIFRLFLETPFLDKKRLFNNQNRFITFRFVEFKESIP